MRITVGGLLVFLGVGTVGAVAFMPTGTVPSMDKHMESARQLLNESLGLFRSASRGATDEKPSPLTSPETPKTATPTEEAAATTTTIPTTTIPTTAIPTTPVTATVVDAPKPVVSKKKSRRRKKKVAAKKPASAKATAGKPVGASVQAVPAAPVAAAVPKKSGGSLIGSQVILTLNTGREVRGILQEQDATQYKVELPGLGVFPYPIQNVKSIRAK